MGAVLYDVHDTIHATMSGGRGLLRSHRDSGNCAFFHKQKWSQKKCHDDLWKVWHSTTASHPITEYHIFMIRNAVLLSIQQGAESAALPALLRAENASC